MRQHRPVMGRPTKGPWEVCNAIDVYPVGDTEARRHIANCDMYNAPLEANEDHPDTDMSFAECRANARLIAAAGTVANQLFDAGLDGIEAVKALPEFVKFISRVSALGMIVEQDLATIDDCKTASEHDTVIGDARNLLARLKGDAE